MSIAAILSNGVLGMLAQSTKLRAVSDNIANLNTVAHKRSEVNFLDLVRTVPGLGDGGPAGGDRIGMGVTAVMKRRVDAQGPLQQTDNDLDLALNGRGFFRVSSHPDADDVLLTRRGQFMIDALVEGGERRFYVQTLERKFLHGTPYNLDGTLDDTVGPIRLSEHALVPQKPTTEVALALEIPDDAGELSLPVEVTLREADTLPMGAAAQDDYVQRFGGVANLPAAPTRTLTGTVTRSAEGLLQLVIDGADPVVIENGGTYPLPGADGVTLSIRYIAVREGAPARVYAQANGQERSTIQRYRFTDDGDLVALDDKGNTTKLYNLPVYAPPAENDFAVQNGGYYYPSDPEGLQAFRIRTVAADDAEAAPAILVAQAVEQSNVDLAVEMSHMIMAQRGYAAASKAVVVGDQMMQILRDLA